MIRSAYLSVQDPHSHVAWSGTHHRLFTALQACSTECVALAPLDSMPLRIMQRLNRISWRLQNHELIAHHSALAANIYAGSANASVRKAAPDVIFAPASSVEIYHLRTTAPIIYLSDATPRLLDGYYPGFTAKSSDKKQALEHFEAHAIQRADALIYPTHWVAESAINHYGADPAKVHVLPFGPNFDIDIQAPQPRTENSNTIRILFVGKDWKRKGADLAYHAVRQLRSTGMDVHLLLCGCVPEEPIDSMVATIVPMIDKQKPGGYEALRTLYASADLFLLPTRAECAGVVFSEAAAFGLPIVATHTGGVPTMVANGLNGMLLPPEADAEAYARILHQLLSDRPRLATMAKASRMRFEEILNWSHFANGLASVIHNLTGKPIR